MLDNQGRGLLSLRYRYTNVADRQRARQLLWVNLALVVAWLIGLVVIVLPALFLGGVFLVLNLLYLLLALPLAAVFMLVQRGQLQAATWLYVVMLSGTILPVVLTIDIPALPMLLIVPLTAAGIFLGRRGLALFLVVMVIAVGARTVFQSQYTRIVRFTPADVIPRDLGLIGISLGMAALLLYIANGGNQRIIRASQRDMELLRQIADFRQALGTTPSENDIFLRALRLLQIDLGYTLAQLFVQDELGGYVRLRLAGTDLMSRNTLNRLNVSLNDDPSAVGEAMRLLQPISASTESSPLRSSHLMPPAHAGIALPLIADGAVIGVLDIQAESLEALSDTQQDGLERLAAQLAGALAEIRNVAELQRIKREQEDTINRYRTQVFEMQQRTQQLITSGWERYIQGRGGEAFGFDVSAMNGSGLSTTPAADLPDDIRNTLERGEIYVEARDGVYVVNVPINYRGDVLGAMTFTVQQPLTERQTDLLRTVATRLGLALENNRLYEQSQAQAARERKAGEIASRLITATDIQSVLSLAAESFNEALGAVHTRVYLEPIAAADDGAPADSRNGVLS
jgi:GAF domain-containing protein